MSQRNIRQWSQRERRAAFTDVCQRLELELRIEVPRTPRRRLDVYLRLAERELEGIGSPPFDGFVAEGRKRLDELRERVINRGFGIHVGRSN